MEAMIFSPYTVEPPLTITFPQQPTPNNIQSGVLLYMYIKPLQQPPPYNIQLYLLQRVAFVETLPCNRQIEGYCCH